MVAALVSGALVAVWLSVSSGKLPSAELVDSSDPCAIIPSNLCGYGRLSSTTAKTTAATTTALSSETSTPRTRDALFPGSFPSPFAGPLPVTEAESVFRGECAVLVPVGSAETVETDSPNFPPRTAWRALFIAAASGNLSAGSYAQARITTAFSAGEPFAGSGRGTPPRRCSLDLVRISGLSSCVRSVMKGGQPLFSSRYSTSPREQISTLWS